jgi:UDP-4-amino-4,6-dideoxy-N-acetyl-beta-L-altrosamine transaminase
MRFIGYGRQDIDDGDVSAVVDVLRGDYLTQGPIVERFEAALAEAVGARYAIAVSSGTAGLHLACLAADAGPERRGVTSALSFVASANCLRYCGAAADLLDIHADTLTMDPSLLESRLARAPETSIVIPVHMAGLPAFSKEMRRAAGNRVVIEDACHALGAQYEDGTSVGSGKYSDMAVFSFHPVKAITTAEGGAVVTNDEFLARRLRLLRSHGIERQPDALEEPAIEEGVAAPWYYEQQQLGFNYRLNEIQAALGLSQLAKLDTFIKRRREIANVYDSAFRSLLGMRLLQSHASQRARSGLHLYLIDVDWVSLGQTRASVMQALKEQGVGTQVHYIPIYRQPYHRSQTADFPVTERYYKGCLSLPCFPGMTDEETEHVVLAVRRTLAS